MEIVNDEFWLKQAKTDIENSAQRLDDSAKGLQTFSTWALTIITTGFTAGIFTQVINVRDWVVYVLVIPPILLLIIAEWLCIFARVAVGTDYDARVPDEIADGHNKIIKQKQCRLTIATIVSFAAALFFAFLLGYIISKQQKKEIIPNPYIVSELVGKKQDTVFVAGIFPAKTAVITHLETDGKTFDLSGFQVGDDGIFNYKYAISDSTASRVFVSVKWRIAEKDNVQTFDLERIVLK